MSTKMLGYRTPKGYVAPLRSRAAILAFLSNCPLTDDRGYSEGRYLFCFNVKVHGGFDLSFDHLLATAVEGEMVTKEQAADAHWVKQAREKHEETGKEQLYDWAIETCQKGVHDFSSYKMLWNDKEEADIEWAFLGQSGGWLCLTKFDGIKMDGFGKEELEGLDYKTLNRLHRFVVQCAHDFRREAIVSEIEYNASFTLFSNLCEGECETTEEGAKANPPISQIS